MPKPDFRAFIDGACVPNPGRGTWAVAVAGPDWLTVESFSGILPGRSTNNIAEYEALIHALSLAKSRGAGNVFIRTDSKIVAWCFSRKKKKHPVPHIERLRARVFELARCFDNLSLTWIPREENEDADHLTNEALEGFVRPIPRALDSDQGAGVEPYPSGPQIQKSLW